VSELVKCATCKTEKPVSEMQTCLHAGWEYSVCDMPCMIKFYKGEIKPDIVITPDLEEMVRLGMNPKEYHLHKENLELTEQLAKANERVKELEKERETGYEVWQANYQALKDSMSLTTCYECGTRVYELSPRSRCCMCEYGRAQFNERENEQLRKEQE